MLVFDLTPAKVLVIYHSTQSYLEKRQTCSLIWPPYLSHPVMSIGRGGSRIFQWGGHKVIVNASSNARGARMQRAKRAVARGVWGHAPPRNF